VDERLFRGEGMADEGSLVGRRLEADGRLLAFLHFIGNAQLLRRLETVEKALANNAKIVVPSNTELINVIGELAGGIIPIPKK